MWWLYELLLGVGLLLYVPSALWRRRLPHQGWSMRLGRYPAAVLDRLKGQQVLWVHAVSVGEVLAAHPFLQALSTAYPDDPLVLSTITPGGFDVATKRSGTWAVPVYFPLDFSLCAARALDRLRPRILVLMESELWPNLIRLVHGRGIPILVVNGRISAPAYRRYLWVRPWLRGMLRRVSRFLMQSAEDANRVIQLGAPKEKVQVVGSLKWDASLAARPTPEDVQALCARIGLNGSRSVIVAGSTHRGEEAILLRAFAAVRTQRTGLGLILAPRHLERLSEVDGLIAHAGLRGCRLSQVGADTPWDVMIVDTFGQLPRVYGLATVAFIGGSLIPHGGQNPLEAASLGKPLLFGPSMDNFAAIVHELLAHHAARQVSNERELTDVLQELLFDPSQANEMGRRARELTEQFQGATQRTLEALHPWLTSSWPKGYG